MAATKLALANASRHWQLVLVYRFVLQHPKKTASFAAGLRAVSQHLLTQYPLVVLVYYHDVAVESAAYQLALAACSAACDGRMSSLKDVVI